MFWIVFIIVVAGAGYWLWYTAQQSGGEEVNNNSQLANPASVYCLDQGGTLDMREDEMGTQGFCAFPDGIACDEWAFYRGEACQDKATSPSDHTPTDETATSSRNEETIGGDEPWENPLDIIPF